MIIPVAVEKLAQREFAEIASRQEAPQTIFPARVDIFYHPIFDFFQKNRVFQQPPLFATVSRKTSVLDYEPNSTDCAYSQQKGHLAARVLED